jgi:hypothetical protein
MHVNLSLSLTLQKVRQRSISKSWLFYISKTFGDSFTVNPVVNNKSPFSSFTKFSSEKAAKNRQMGQVKH